MTIPAGPRHQAKTLARERQKRARLREVESARNPAEVYGWRIERGSRGHRRRLVWDIDGDSMHAAMALTALRDELLKDLEAELVLTMRRDGIDWETIGWSLGVTRQAARARHPDTDRHLRAEGASGP